MRKLTHEEFLKHINLNEYEILGVYENSRAQIKTKCKTCGHIWFPKANNLINGSGCPICGNILRSKTQMYNNKKFINDLARTNNNIVALDEYRGTHQYIRFKCLICSHEWNMRPHDAFGKNHCGCPKCSHQKRLKTFNERYGGDTPFASQVIRDKAARTNEANGWRRVKSVGENSIKLWLNDHKIKYAQEAVFEDCRDQRMLPFDFKILNKDGSLYCLIEYDGEQHTRGWDGEPGSLEIIQQHDALKTKYCEDNGIKLIRISYQQNPQEILTEELKGYSI